MEDRTNDKTGALTVLFLGGNLSHVLADWLTSKGEKVCFHSDRIKIKQVEHIKPDIIVSYNYKYLLSKDIIEFPTLGAVNLHISFLPWNRGYHPNVWSFIDDTPKGVTIHYIDEGIDTGDIIVQKKVYIDEDKETLKSSYDILQKEIQKLFKKYWNKIIKKLVKPMKQDINQGSLHYKQDIEIISMLINKKGWNLKISELPKFHKMQTG